MAHTHLVKGLDYSLLNKVRSEMQKSHIERVNDELEDALVRELSILNVKISYFSI